MAIEANDVIVFQGDSITDTGRNRGVRDANHPAAMGQGYAFLAAATLLAKYPQHKLKIYNRGVSGDKVFQLANRWQTDTIDLKPTIVSILIGVNDIWHMLAGNYDGTAKVYEDDLHTLIDRTRRELPEARIVLCEPFVTRTGVVNDSWFPEFDVRRAAAKRQAETFNLTWVPFQSMFDAAVKEADPAYWAYDGVHPTLAGHQRMAQAWLRAVDA